MSTFDPNIGPCVICGQDIHNYASLRRPLCKECERKHGRGLNHLPVRHETVVDRLCGDASCSDPLEGHTA